MARQSNELHNPGSADVEACNATTAPGGQHDTHTSAPMIVESHARGKDEALSENSTVTLEWDGPDDPENPLNWPKSKRYMQVITIATYTLVT